ncbi:Oidioi.mRNA.OKI2018_I69.XSR.g13902.t2.cds [Oikopleura dioica]|uniref:Oidioi.mRNA.OKI2018_I69.XSR.g13902.t2.cds n=1 Tax=Oikopleura dioica TaxID=34765 RepID=A0ABN7SC29_OIKDI|nr:Oidioi.mRNA.OKI2018_I69.XSR.g13902.t2.cds [Oikopleura dioica]
MENYGEKMDFECENVISIRRTYRSSSEENCGSHSHNSNNSNSSTSRVLDIDMGNEHGKPRLGLYRCDNISLALEDEYSSSPVSQEEDEKDRKKKKKRDDKFWKRKKEKYFDLSDDKRAVKTENERAGGFSSTPASPMSPVILFPDRTEEHLERLSESDIQALKAAENEKFSSSVAEELSGVRVDIDRKIETYENLTPAELRNAEFQASRLRKKESFLAQSQMIHRIKSQLGRISKEAKIEDELPLEPPEENAKLLRWVEQFIPSEHKAHVSARLKHLLLEKNAAECIWESTEASSGHVVVQRDVRQKRREQEAKSFSIITERRLDGEAFEIETDSGELELPTKSNGAAQECAAYVLGSLLEGSMNLVKEKERLNEEALEKESEEIASNLLANLLNSAIKDTKKERLHQEASEISASILESIVDNVPHASSEKTINGLVDEIVNLAVDKARNAAFCRRILDDVVDQLQYTKLNEIGIQCHLPSPTMSPKLPRKEKSFCLTASRTSPPPLPPKPNSLPQGPTPPLPPKTSSNPAPPPPPPPAPPAPFQNAGGPPPPPPPPGCTPGGPPPPPSCVPGGPPPPPPAPGCIPGGPPPPPPGPSGPGGPPPPPPPPGCVPGGPPPPPCPPGAAGGPPPPPPAPGMAGPPGGPPPPPGAPGMPPMMGMAPVAQAGPRKPTLQPKQRMKPLYWNRLQVHELQKRRIDPSTLLWDKLQEVELIQESVLEAEFSQSANIVKPKAKKVEKPKKIQPVKLLDPKRWQSVGIFMSSLKVDVDSLRSALVSMDTKCDMDLLRGVYELRGSKEELTEIKSYLKGQEELPEEKRVPVDKPETFLLKLDAIPQFDTRVACFIFHETFMENTEAVDSKLIMLNDLVKIFRTGEEIRRILGMVLRIGNYLNGGNRTRGQADGFKLDVLQKIRDVKMNNGGTMLTFIVRQYITVFQDDYLETATCPVPNITKILKVSQLEFDQFTRDTTKLLRDHKKCSDMLATVELEASEDDKEPFYSSTKKKLETARTKIDSLGLDITKARKNFRALMDFYAVQPKKPNVDPEPKEFFDLWTSFCAEFKDIWEREIKLAMKRKKQAEVKKAQERVEFIRRQQNSDRKSLNSNSSPKTGDKPTSRKSGLKSRLRESRTMDSIPT